MKNLKLLFLSIISFSGVYAADVSMEKLSLAYYMNLKKEEGETRIYKLAAGVPDALSTAAWAVMGANLKPLNQKLGAKVDGKYVVTMQNVQSLSPAQKLSLAYYMNLKKEEGETRIYKLAAGVPDALSTAAWAVMGANLKPLNQKLGAKVDGKYILTLAALNAALDSTSTPAAGGPAAGAADTKTPDAAPQGYKNPQPVKRTFDQAFPPRTDMLDELAQSASAVFKPNGHKKARKLNELTTADKAAAIAAIKAWAASKGLRVQVTGDSIVIEDCNVAGTVDQWICTDAEILGAKVSELVAKWNVTQQAAAAGAARGGAAAGNA